MQGVVANTEFSLIWLMYFALFSFLTLSYISVSTSSCILNTPLSLSNLISNNFNTVVNLFGFTTIFFRNLHLPLMNFVSTGNILE